MGKTPWESPGSQEQPGCSAFKDSSGTDKLQSGHFSVADAIAQQRYKTSIETFLIGKINTLDLNDAQNSKDEARQKHISELYYYWYYYYQIRSLTLWDFRTNTELEADFDEIIRQ